MPASHNLQVTISLPQWVNECLPEPDHIFRTREDRMRLVIELSHLNVTHKTGGPFGAGIFDRKSKRLLSVGVNLVVQSKCSIFHAEMLAIMMAQKMANTYDLGAEDMPSCEMVTSTEPCAMCMGAITWSGIRTVVCGARDEDARRIGFDEGPKAPDWIQALEKRGITVVRDVCRHDAATVLDYYLKNNGILYNSRRGK